MDVPWTEDLVALDPKPAYLPDSEDGFQAPKNLRVWICNAGSDLTGGIA